MHNLVITNLNILHNIHDRISPQHPHNPNVLNYIILIVQWKPITSSTLHSNSVTIIKNNKIIIKQIMMYHGQDFIIITVIIIIIKLNKD
jgi:hypothetical protein